MINFAFGIKDIVDIFLVAIILYYVYKLMRGSGAINLFVGVMTFLVSWFLVVYVFQLELLGSIFNRIIDVGAIALIIIFQNEIRRFFARLGSKSNWALFTTLWGKFIPNGERHTRIFPIMAVVLACRDMAKTKTGALIVIERETDLQEIIETGDEINAKINTRLIQNIFFKNSPLHDGAMIMADGVIKSAGAILPVSKNPEIPRHLGLRHRAALGISEITDAVVVIISEESGVITMAIDGSYIHNLTPEQLERELSTRLDADDIDS